MARANVPRDFAEMAADIQAADLVVLSRRSLRSTKVFNTPAEAYRFGVAEGWGAGFFAVTGLPMGFVRSIARWGVNQCDYPFKFMHVTEIIAVGRAGEHPGAAAANQYISPSRGLLNCCARHECGCKPCATRGWCLYQAKSGTSGRGYKAAGLSSRPQVAGVARARQPTGRHAGASFFGRTGLASGDAAAAAAVPAPVRDGQDGET